MPKINTYHSLKLLLVLMLISLLTSCLTERNGDIDIDIFFSAEKLTETGDNLYADNDSAFIFKGAKFRSNLASFSGVYSYLTSPKNAFALGIHIPTVRPDNYVTIGVWKKGHSLKAHLVASGITPDLLYHSTNLAVEQKDGWEKLELDFFLPPNYTDNELKIYVWNNSGDTVFFDDLSINIKSHKSYPEYEENALYIEVDTSEYIKLIDIRKKAFDLGILQSADDHWVKGFVISDDKMMKTKLRLKGDWLDHLHGEKWSFRLKLKSGYTWNRMRTFSLHNPITRHGVDEWFLHQVSLSQDVLTTRYGFVPTFFYSKNLGIYAWEEHFTKQLIESQKKREGPIVRFYEDVYWDQVRGKKSGIDSIKIPFFEAAAIKPFSTSKVVEDTAIFKQFLIAQNLLLQYKNRIKSASEIFNIDALARYYAICDVFLAHHSIIWHNQRFYYNPVLCKLEPILFDAYIEDGYYKWVSRSIIGDIQNNSVQSVDDQYLMMRELFNDFEFLDQYVKYLEIYSSEGFLKQINSQFSEEAMRSDSLIQKEFPELRLDISILYKNADNIRNDLPLFKQKIADRQLTNKKWLNVSKSEKQFTKGLDGYYASNLVLAYKMKQQGDSTMVRVVNYFTDPILLLGVGTNDKIIREFLHPEPELEKYLYPDKIQYEFWIHSTANYLFVMTGKDQQTVTTAIMQWPEPDGSLSPLQDLLGKNIFPDPQFVESVQQKKVIVKTGEFTIDHSVVVPPGFELVIKPGTKIDLVNKAGIISYSPVILQGTHDKPIIITSSDFTANGFTVLQADGKSVIDHVIFENLNTLDYKGWTLTGAVTFYESDVEITNTKFYRNQCEDALNTIRSEFIVKKTSFDHIYGDAFDSDFCTGLVDFSTFSNIGNDAIDFSGSQITIRDTKIENINDKGISGGENSKLLVERTMIHQANIGVASKDLSLVQINNSSISDCNYGLVLLQKKPEYGPATIELNNTELINSKTDMLIEKGSKVNKEGLIIHGKEEKLADIFYK